MKVEYDLSIMKSRRNPYASQLKKPVTTRHPEDVMNLNQLNEDAHIRAQSHNERKTAPIFKLYS